MIFVHRPARARQREEFAQSGFTLIEVMVVVAMIAIITTAAVVLVNPRSYAATARGYTQDLTALADSMRQRAVASRTYQKLEVRSDRVLHWQADTTGMSAPEDWTLVATVYVPAEVVISSTSPRTHIKADDDVPDEGANLPFEIDFAPDGTVAAGATIFVQDNEGENRARVAIYRATGSAYTYYEW